MTYAPIEIENARIIFKNFSGEKTKFNTKGDRTFSVIIEDPELANSLKAEGWNVQSRPVRDDPDAVLYTIPVKINLDSFPNIPGAKVFIFDEETKHLTQLNEDNIGELDSADIKKIDLTLRPRFWDDESDGRKKIKAYLKEMYVTLNESRFERKYNQISSDVEESIF